MSVCGVNPATFESLASTDDLWLRDSDSPPSRAYNNHQLAHSFLDFNPLRS